MRKYRVHEPHLGDDIIAGLRRPKDSAALYAAAYDAAAEIERLRGVLMGVMAWIDPANETEVSASEVFAKLRADLVANEQSEPPLVHVGRDGQPHNGPRAACTICFMWDQIASNEQNGSDK